MVAVKTINQIIIQVFLALFIPFRFRNYLINTLVALRELKRDKIKNNGRREVDKYHTRIRY